ncbi:MAG: PHP domain-containing protein, partial [Clostridia bacterium]|nr:PHP domain-containing protein [Clostridia bacterium]
MKEELKAAYDAAHLKADWLTIKSVSLSRETQTLTVSADRIKNLISDESLKAWEAAIRSLLSPYTVTFEYRDVEPERVAVKPVPQKKNEVDVPIPENGVLLGKPIPEGAEELPIFELNGEEETKAVVSGRLVSVEIRDDWSMRQKKPNCRVQFNVTDLNDSIYCTASFPEEWQAARFAHWLEEAAKGGKDLRIKGVCKLIKKSGDRSFYADAVGVLPRTLRSDDAEEKRVELHLHSRMSTMDGITNLTEAFRTAKRWGHKALAITDHGVVQAFPEAAKAAKSTGVKAIFGVEGYLIPDCESIPADGDFTVFDIETTGLKADRCDIIEIGAVRLHEGKVVDRFQSFIDDGVVVPGEITKLTGITQSMLEGAPTTREVLERFRVFAEGSTLVAHNASFDTGFITHHGDRFGVTFPMPYADTLMLSRYLLRDELENHKLDTISAYFNIDMGSHHRADDDANTCAQILLRFIDMLKARGIDRIPVVPNAHEAYLRRTAKEKRQTNHIILLARTQKGMKDLYKLISWSHLDYLHVRPQIPKSLLMLYRSDLIVGSACEAGELFRAVLNGESQEKIEKIASFYDYFEIQPIGNNAFLKREGTVQNDEGLRDLNRKIVDLGEKLGKPVAATGDVHFLEPTDAIYRAI